MKATITGVLSVVLLGLAAGVATAEETDVSGNWTMTMTTPRGERTSALVIVQNGEAITVTSKTERGESTGTGTVTGNEIQWSITRETPMGEMTMTYKGTVEGDTMTGEVNMMGNPMPWKATRDE